MSPKPAPSQSHYCASCDTKHADRDELRIHKGTWVHKANTTRKAYAAKGWAPVRLTSAEFFADLKAAGIPADTAPYIDSSGKFEKLDQFGRGEYVSYVPQPVADACKEWLALPADVKKSQPLLDYLKTMFVGVDWQKHLLDEVMRAASAQERDKL